MSHPEDMTIQLEFSYEKWLVDPSTCVIWHITTPNNPYWNFVNKEKAERAAGIAKGFVQVLEDHFNKKVTATGLSRYDIARKLKTT